MARKNPKDWDNLGERFHHLKYELETPQGIGCGGWRLDTGLKARSQGQMPAWVEGENLIMGEMNA